MSSASSKQKPAARIKKLLREVQTFGETVRQHLQKQKENSELLDRLLPLQHSKAPREQEKYRQYKTRRSRQQQRLNEAWDLIELKIYDLARETHVCLQLARLAHPGLRPLFVEFDAFYDRTITPEDHEGEPKGMTAMWDILVGTSDCLEKASQAIEGREEESVAPPPPREELADVSRNRKSVPVPREIRKALRAVIERERPKVSKAAACKKLGLSRKTLTKVLDGDKPVHQETLDEVQRWLEQQVPAGDNPQR